jgi:superfamily I DNA/RNA helicase
MREFTQDYPDAPVYKLSQSYRCSDRILEASGQVISADTPSSLKGLIQGVKLTVQENDTDRSEAEYIARTIEKLIGGVSFFSVDSDVTDGERDEEISSLSDFAVLFRISRQGELIAEAMRNHNIPCQLVRTDCELRDNRAIDFLKLAENPQHTIIAERAVKRCKLDADAARDIIAFASSLTGNPVEEALKEIADSYLDANEVQPLLGAAEDCGKTIGEFIASVELGSGVDRADLNAEQVTLMTLHAAKGLEFKCVFIAGCEDGLIPYTLFEDKKSDTEEERRLLYVGMTRAQRFLYLCNAKKRLLFGRTLNLLRSPFAEQIEKDLVKMQKAKRKKRKRPEEDGEQLTFF